MPQSFTLHLPRTSTWYQVAGATSGEDYVCEDYTGMILGFCENDFRNCWDHTVILSGLCEGYNYGDCVGILRAVQRMASQDAASVPSTGAKSSHNPSRTPPQRHGTKYWCWEI